MENIRQTNNKEAIEELKKKIDKNSKVAGGGVADSFSDLPIESLISAPILSAAKDQRELCSVYLNEIEHLAYKDQRTVAIPRTFADIYHERTDGEF